MPELHRLDPESFCAFLRERGIRRAFLAPPRPGEPPRASHEALAPLAAWLASERRDHREHEAVFFQVGPETGALQGAFVHRTCRGQAAGGVRLRRYDTIESWFRDGLRLSYGMTLKNALAGLWWGGGKGVIDPAGAIDPEQPGPRRRLYEEYGAFISSLRGCYVTAEDSGTTAEDMAAVFSRTRFTTCIPPEFGGSGNPSGPTARGVVCGMRAALDHLGMGGLRGKSVAVQGLGEVGGRLVTHLLEAGVARVVGADPDARRIEALRRRHPDAPLELRQVPAGDESILAEPVDILSPCAVGGVLNSRTIPSVRARVVCGAANNQLEDPEADDERLAGRGIVYVPDFLVNRMGIVNCADEQYGSVPDDPRVMSHLDDASPHGIYRTARDVLDRA
ncbi:MAG: Glu/Leu/Phe/Val dehydrogenase, partial [Acidobacteria bacterium]